MTESQTIDVKKIQEKAVKEAVEILEKGTEKKRATKLNILLAMRPFLVAARRIGLSYPEIQKEISKRFRIKVSQGTLKKAYKLIRIEELEKLYEAVERKIETDDKDIVDFNFAKVARSKGYTKEEVRDFLLAERTDTRKGEKLIEYVARTVERAWSTTQ